MSKTIVTLLLVALAVAPSLAQEKATKTAGAVTFRCEVEGSDKDGFTFSAKNTGTDASCDAKCTLTLTKNGSTSTKESKYNGSVRGDGHPEENIGGESSVGGKLSNPEITASCK